VSRPAAAGLGQSSLNDAGAAPDHQCVETSVTNPRQRVVPVGHQLASAMAVMVARMVATCFEPPPETA
jgi:hypothetical protein